MRDLCGTCQRLFILYLIYHLFVMMVSWVRLILIGRFTICLLLLSCLRFWYFSKTMYFWQRFFILRHLLFRLTRIFFLLLRIIQCLGHLRFSCFQ
jgi:hypothetical protein